VICVKAGGAVAWPVLVRENLRVETLSVLLRDDHPLARKRQIEFKALKDVALVSLPLRSRTRRLIDAAATAAGFSLRHAVTRGLPITLLTLVRSALSQVSSRARW
jgi:hypothetical protein